MTARPLMVRSKNAGPFTLTIDVIFNEPDRRAAAVKITTGRLIPAGSFGDLDLYGCQQHVGVMEFMGLLGRSDIASPLR
jgi:hypothetical protein